MAIVATLALATAAAVAMTEANAAEPARSATSELLPSLALPRGLDILPLGEGGTHGKGPAPSSLVRGRLTVEEIGPTASARCIERSIDLRDIPTPPRPAGFLGKWSSQQRLVVVGARRFSSLRGRGKRNVDFSSPSRPTAYAATC